MIRKDQKDNGFVRKAVKEDTVKDTETQRHRGTETQRHRGHCERGHEYIQ